MGPRVVLLFVICATGVYAATDVVQANLYVTDSPIGQAYGANVTAGETLVADFQLRDVQTNATLGNSLGYCILLRAAGPNQCLYTIQFASGTIQVAGITYSSASAGYNNLTTGLLAIIGGTGLYTGATGYYQETNFNPNLSAGTGPDGVVININYGST